MHHGPVIGYFTHRTSGKVVALLTAVSLAYGWFILRFLPMWRHLVAAQGGAELQGTLRYDAQDVARVFGAFDESLRTDALLFYAVDVPNAVLFAASVAALLGFAIHHLGAANTALRWLIVLPLVSGASDLVENTSLAATLLSSPDTPSPLGVVAATATIVKLVTGYLALGLMLLLGAAALARHIFLRSTIQGSKR
jgi:hypothetical protein